MMTEPAHKMTAAHFASRVCVCPDCAARYQPAESRYSRVGLVVTATLFVGIAIWQMLDAHGMPNLTQVGIAALCLWATLLMVVPSRNNRPQKHGGYWRGSLSVPSQRSPWSWCSPWSSGR
jgi:hypothetical protein